MPPRGNEGLDFTPIITHYLFLFTTVLSGVRFTLFHASDDTDMSTGCMVPLIHLPVHRD